MKATQEPQHRPKEKDSSRLKVVYAPEGTGPLLERSYSAVIEGASCTPEQVAEMIRARFADFAPAETALFARCEGTTGPLDVGDELEIRLALLGKCKVRVVHVDAQSMTMRTLEGHPEAGRITFGAWRDDGGRLHFQIGSRTRAAGLVHYLGYKLLGKQMQSRCWIKFVNRVAEECGGRIVDAIRVRTHQITEEPADRGEAETPTFRCDGGD